MWQFLSLATVSADNHLFDGLVNFIPLEEIMISLNVRVLTPKNSGETVSYVEQTLRLLLAKFKTAMPTEA